MYNNIKFVGIKIKNDYKNLLKNLEYNKAPFEINKIIYHIRQV